MLEFTCFRSRIFAEYRYSLPERFKISFRPAWPRVGGHGAGPLRRLYYFCDRKLFTAGLQAVTRGICAPPPPPFIIFELASNKAGSFLQLR